MDNVEKFYVYEHWRPDTNCCFYVGKGRKIRIYNMSKRNEHHKAIQEKMKKMGLSIKIVIVQEFFSENEALNFEKERILFWRNQNVKLVNQTDGGDGLSGYKLTQEQKDHKSIVSKRLGLRPPVLFGNKNGFYGKKHTLENREKMSIAALNRKVSDDTKEKLSKWALDSNVRPPRFVGKEHPNFGRKMPEEQKQRMSATKKANNLKKRFELCHL